MKITLKEVKQIILDYHYLLEECSIKDERDKLDPIVKAIEDKTFEIVDKEEVKGDE